MDFSSDCLDQLSANCQDLLNRCTSSQIAIMNGSGVCSIVFKHKEILSNFADFFDKI